MKFTAELTDDAVLMLIGERVERQRIEANLTQAELAREAGLSKRTVERIEAGKGCELVMLIRVLRVLKLSEGLNVLLPDLPPSPIALLRMKGKQRRRVAHPRRGGASRVSSAVAPEPNHSAPLPKRALPWKE